VERGGPNVGGDEDEMENKINGYKGGDERKRSENGETGVMDRRKMVGMG